MQTDFAALTGGQIALVTAVATLCAALVAGMFALVSAGIGAWNARWLARDSARRQYRQEALSRALVIADECGSRLALFYGNLKRRNVDEAERILRDLATTDNLFKNIAFTTVVTADKAFSETAKGFARAHITALENAFQALDRARVGGEHSTETEERDQHNLFDNAYDLRQHAEDFILGTHRNAKRIKKIRRIEERLAVFSAMDKRIEDLTKKFPPAKL